MSPCSLDILSRLKGIETNANTLPVEKPFKSLDILSRLKGIETMSPFFSNSPDSAIFGYTFPFEGNWNLASQYNNTPINNSFGYTFPFEGNWNFCPRILLGVKLPVTLDILSRLKGIETCHLELRRSIGIPLDILSRLKGIETHNSLLYFVDLIFGYTFPFEGNWNGDITTWIHLNRYFGYTFPFEGNWNDTAPTVEPEPIDFGYTFPFEGNWNLASISPFISVSALDILSRLKGIETKSVRATLCKAWKTFFGYTFPFEGNWNNISAMAFLMFSSLDLLSRLKGIETISIRLESVPRCLWIYFPVWRELKPLSSETKESASETLDLLSRLKGIETLSILKRLTQVGLWIYFPVWRELKRVLGLRGQASPRFGYTFPFEGNWNYFFTDVLANSLHFGYTFPFEGNWNLCRFWKGIVVTSNFGYTFPFEGNWNSRLAGYSRLLPRCWLWIYFPVWRELKLNPNGDDEGKLK